jgi:translation initiation factor 5
MSKHTVEGKEPEPSKQVEELRSLQNLASLRAADRVIILLGAVCVEPTVAATVAAIKKNLPVLRLLAPMDATIQQRQMIAAFEWLCGSKHPSLLKAFPIICKTLLDEEVVEEDTFLMWSVDYARNDFSAEQSLIDIDTLEKLKESAQPFIKWLEEAEEDGDDDEDEEEDEDEEDA